MACAVGRQITHTNSETHPGYQAQCPNPAFNDIVLGAASKGHAGETYKICTMHLSDLSERGLVTPVSC